MANKIFLTHEFWGLCVAILGQLVALWVHPRPLLRPTCPPMSFLATSTAETSLQPKLLQARLSPSTLLQNRVLLLLLACSAKSHFCCVYPSAEYSEAPRSKSGAPCDPLKQATKGSRLAKTPHNASQTVQDPTAKSENHLFGKPPLWPSWANFAPYGSIFGRFCACLKSRCLAIP